MSIPPTERHDPTLEEIFDKARRAARGELRLCAKHFRISEC